MASTKSKYQKIDVPLRSGPIAVYAGEKVRSALKEITADMSLYHGVRLSQVLEAVYETGLKNGRKEIIDHFEQLKSKVNYLPPGRPRGK